MAHAGVDDDEMLAAFVEEGDAEELRPRNRPLRRGPLDVGFYAFAHEAPGPDEYLIVKGTLPELNAGVRMQPCETGGRRLWQCTVQINLVGERRDAVPPMGGQPVAVQNAPNLLPLGGVGQVAQPLFEVSYELHNAKGLVRKSEATQEYATTRSLEDSQMRQFYYHRALFAGHGTHTDEAFPLFVHEEIHRLQTGRTQSLREYIQRFLGLVASPFAKRRRLLDRALEELITEHWGRDERPPAQTVLAVAASIGYFRKQMTQSSQATTLSTLYDEHNPEFHTAAAAAADPPAKEGDAKAEKQEPVSKVVCQWVVDHCPRRQDMEDEERAQQEQNRDAGMRINELRRYATAGVQQVADTLYGGEKTFEWLRMLHFLPEHALPSPISASSITEPREVSKLNGAFDQAFAQLVTHVAHLPAPAGAAPAAPAGGGGENSEVETLMRGLCNYCPGVEALRRFANSVRTNIPHYTEILQPMIFNRIRSLSFGEDDKIALSSWMQEGGFMYSDDTGIALLTNTNHPSESFTAQEIVEAVQAATENPQGVRTAGHQLHTSMRRWLLRLYGRNLEGTATANTAVTQSAAAVAVVNAMAGSSGQGPTLANEHQVAKADLVEAIRQAINGWHMVLRLRCFRSDEETVRMLLFELSQAYFFKDPEALMVLECMLELEHDIRGVTVPPLEQELQRITIKSARDAQDMAETEDSEGLLGLLFKDPTPLRYIVIQAFIEFRHAANDLGRMLVNKPIWTRLLQPKWIDARLLSQHSLHKTQRDGITMLKHSAAHIANNRIHLSQLHTILSHQHVYEDLVYQVTGDRPKQISKCQQTLKQFDDEFTHLRTYTRMYCPSASADTQDLANMIEEIKENYATLPLELAAKKFEKLAVRPHLTWLFSLRASDVFSGIWKETAKVCRTRENEQGGTYMRTELLPQDEVVSKVIPQAKKTWEDLAASIEKGAPVLKDIPWMQKYEWKKVQKELELLETTAPKTAPWVPKATEMALAMRLAAKLKEWAPAVLNLHRVLSSLFHAQQNDATITELQQVVKSFENMWEQTLGQMSSLVAPHKATIGMVTNDMQDYIITAAKHDKSMEMLLQHKSLDDFNRLIMLCRPNTDDPLILAGIASLQQTRTFLSEVLYSKPPYSSVKDFLHELSHLTVDNTVHEALRSVQAQFEPMQDLLTTNSRAPGVQACYDLKAISELGQFHVFCSLKESEHIVCKLPETSNSGQGSGREFNYEALQELRRQLLMTDVPEEGVEGASAAALDKMLKQLVEKLGLLEEYGRCTMELFSLGHFSLKSGQDVLQVNPTSNVVDVRKKLEDLQRKLEEWKTAVDEARSKHYFLNYFTLQELCFLAKLIPQVKAAEGEWERVWTLLKVIDQGADATKIKQRILQWVKDGRLPQVTPGGEATLLDSMGSLIGEIFAELPPLVRPLKDLKAGSGARQQHWQGDLLIKSMSASEVNTPLFVCCADNASKVTELVLSIYARRERVPESEELLLCSHRTSMEEIELLLRRFFTARKHKREERLYCLGNVHLLPYVVQVGTVEALRALEERFGYKAASALVFVSGEPNQMLTNALTRHAITVGLLPQESLIDAVQQVGKQYHGKQMQAVAAQMNGVGKTHYILRQVWELQMEAKQNPVLHHVDIRETTTISSLVSALLADPTDEKYRTAVHIDLAHILPSHVDTLLFELLIVGMLRDPQNCTAYHRRHQDIFFVEIPNTPQEQTAKQLSFCLLMPRTYLTMSYERLDSEVPLLHKKPTEKGEALMVTLQRNQHLARVGKVLQAMKIEAFNPKSRQFKTTWKEEHEPEEPLDRVYQLLDDVCCSETSPPSFLVFTNFVHFLGNLVESAEAWNMMDLHLLQRFDPGLKHFKHCLFRLLIETSRDFALRQVPKQMVVVNQSPLAPRLGLARSTSRLSPSPTLSRGISRRGSDGVQRTAVEEEHAGIGRIDITNYTKRFDQMPAWETCVHPIASFKKNEQDKVIGCNIMSLAKDFLSNFIDQNLQNSLNLNDLKLEKDWTSVTHKEAVELVLHVEGGGVLKKKLEIQGPADYVVTVDNLLKLMSIQQRLRYGLPVILMGETGCGKTSLVKFLAKTLDLKLFTLDVHGGIDDEAIMNFLDEAITKTADGNGVMIFFDEINAANCMALFKTIIIDRTYGNRTIPSNVRMISCCNPYRLRRDLNAAPTGIVFQHHAGEGATGIRDPMKQLVYRVHPLPESLIDVVSDFGSLSDKSEELYISAILKKELLRLRDEGEEPAAPAAPAAAAANRTPEAAAYDKFIEALTKLLCASQEFVRRVHDGERSVVSMRDISRAAQVFKWFLTYYTKLKGNSLINEEDGLQGIRVTDDMKPHLRSAVILTLGYCYHARLMRDHRWSYRQRLAETWRTQLRDAAWLQLDDKDLEEKIIETQNAFVEPMELEPGIALNEALRENLFMLLVSIMNQIPILLIGKPGCSKSLAITVLQNNLNGEVSKNEFFRSMPAVDVMPYQCSPLSTPEAILQAFQHARFGNLGYKKTIVCVLLDEVGLAEESPHLPLKVLHKELEDLRGIACVGISNWFLDAAKMNRCVTLQRPPAIVEDLIATAQGMVSGEGLKNWLRALSEAFYSIYHEQSRTDFWGMREFYSTVRVINSALKKLSELGKPATLEPEVLMKTVQRNFGGMPDEDNFGINQVIEEFFDKCGMDYERVERFSTKELIQQNLAEPDARHLMLLTKNNAALRLLFESGLLSWSASGATKQAEVMFGSTFPGDQSDVFVAMNLQRIKSFMQQPISLVMVHCDSLYESLYDLLNQHYMEYGGQRYVRIAHGSKAKQCPVHTLFRVIVVVEAEDAYHRLAPPLLNRFEKQIFLRKDLMQRQDDALLKRLMKFWEALLESVETVRGEDEAAAPKRMRYNPVAGYHSELLSSLVFTLRQQEGKTIEELEVIARRMLTWVLMPEAVCIIASRYSVPQMQMKFGFNLVSEYFEDQRHSDLHSFTEAMLTDKDFHCDQYGAQVMVMTYSPIRNKIGHELESKLDAKAAEVSLHELTSSTDMEKSVRDFYLEAEKGLKKNIFLIHADPIAASLRMIEHCRFVCERERSLFVARAQDSGKKELLGSAIVIMVVHLQRGQDSSYSFDFDSKWRCVFLDSVEPAQDMSNMPSLGEMLNMPLIEVMNGLDFTKLLKLCFRSSLSRLIYPHSRRPEDLQAQILLILRYLDEYPPFIQMVRTWMLDVLEKTPKVRGEGSVGQDCHWFADIATEAHELALAGTYRMALHNRIVVLISSLFTALLAHLDRNGGLILMETEEKRQLWLSLSTASLSSPLSGRLHNEAAAAVKEDATVHHEVGTDALTAAKPFQSKMPSSWFVTKSLLALRHAIEPLPPAEQLAGLQQQYERMTRLHEVGLNPVLGEKLLDDYLADFTAMHLEWTIGIPRERQAMILKKMLQRFKNGPLTSILEVHQLFWASQKSVSYCVSLLNSVPHAIPRAEELIDRVPVDKLNLELLVLVHEALYEEVTEEPAQVKNSTSETACKDFYRDWLRRKQIVSNLMKNFLQTFPDSAGDSLKMLKADYEPRVETIALFMSDVLNPLEVHMIREVQDMDRRVKEVKKDREDEIKRRSDERDKRIAEMRKERIPFSIVLQLARDLPKGKTRHSATFLAMLKVGEQAMKNVGKMKDKFLETMGTFIESWMLDICLRDAGTTNDTEEQCLKLLCGVAVGLQVKIEPKALQGIVVAGLDGWDDKNEVGISKFPQSGAEIPRSSSLNLAMLRKLLVTATGRARELATAEIEMWLFEIAKHIGHNDSTTATKYAVLCEEAAAEKLEQLKTPGEWPNLTLDAVFSKDRAKTPSLILKDVGEVRWMLAQYAKVLCDPRLVKFDDQALAVKYMGIQGKVDELLHTEKDSEHSKVCRSMRLFLLKCMDRIVGSTAVRGALAVPPLSEANWLKLWRDEMRDIDFEKFIGAALVPKWNPFSGADGFKEYPGAKGAVLKMMNSESCQALSTYGKDCAKEPEDKQRRLQAALVLALCQEPGLLSALEDDKKPPAWRAELSGWFKNSQDLVVSDRVRLLMRIFSGDPHAFEGVPADKMKYLEALLITGSPPMDQLLRWRVLGHLAAALISASPQSLLAALRKIMLDPQDLSVNQKVFIPGMDEDIRNRVMKALLERGENIWKFKSHWYKCAQCGYSFFIGECGRPMEETQCPNCNAKIGGKDHTKTTQTVEDDETDRSPPGYMLPDVERDEKHVTFRDMASSSARLVRLLLHGSMFLGMAAHSKTPEKRVYDGLVNQDSMCTMHQTLEVKYIYDHWLNDWEQLVTLLGTNNEDLAAIIHSLLGDMMSHARDEPKNQVDSGSGGLNWEKLSMQMRNAWEETMDTKYLLNTLKNVEVLVKDLYDKWSGHEEDGKFMAELKERADVRDYPKEKRASELPQLWAARAAVTLDALHLRIAQERNADELYPVLRSVVQAPLFKMLGALGCLVGVFEWHSLINNHLSGRITRQKAGEKTIREFLNEFPPAERAKWEVAYEALEEAWRIAWKFVERHECLELPEHLKQVQLTKDTKLVWAIVDQTGEGICPHALTQFLVERHNELAQVVSHAIGYEMRRVSSRMLAQHDAVTFDAEDLEHFLRSRCVTYGIGGKLNFDLPLLEQHLRQKLTRPEITMEVRTFSWLGESFTFSTAELKEVIRQKDLNQDVRERLRNELKSKALANQCLQKVQMSVSFILKSGGALGGEAGEMLLSEYLRSVLCETDDVLLSATARSEVHLWHVDNFVKLLQQIIGGDPMDGVEPRYTIALPPEIAQQLISLKDSLPESFLEQMALLALAQLSEGYLSPEAQLLDVLLAADFSEADRAVVDTQLRPLGLLMKHWVEVYRAVAPK